MSRQFDSNTNALKHRANINAQGSTYNLEDWIIEQTKPQSGMRVLDLGCGTGKQIFRLAPIVSFNGLILGIDISPDAVDEVNRRAQEEHLDFVKAVRTSLDDCIEKLRGQTFDLILSTYAVYYASDMTQLLVDLRSNLNPGGRLFVCGPGRDSNREMFDLINSCSPGPYPGTKPVEDFLGETQIIDIAKQYSKVATVRLANQIRFQSPESVLLWWKNHNSFVPEIYESVERSLHHHFSQHDSFVLTKNVLGVDFHVRTL
jgi:ubiquinone/menaquinone biosynthesis C-methylase UbiE